MKLDLTLLLFYTNMQTFTETKKSTVIRKEEKDFLPKYADTSTDAVV